MKRGFADYAAGILTSCQEVQEFTQGMDFAMFAADKKTINAVVRSLSGLAEVLYYFASAPSPMNR